MNSITSRYKKHQLKMKFHATIILAISLFSCFISTAQNRDFASVSTSVNAQDAKQAIDKDSKTGWKLGVNDLKNDQYLIFTLNSAEDITEVILQAKGIKSVDLKKMVQLFITIDPMNLGTPVPYSVKGNKDFTLKFPAKYGAHLKIQFLGGIVEVPISINEIGIGYEKKSSHDAALSDADKPWMNTQMPIKERIERLLAVMTPEEKMELIREGWGIPGIKRLGIPAVKKVEALHGFSYGTGATVFPQSIGLGATWDKTLVEEVAQVIGKETADVGSLQAWSPVLDVAQDARWGRCEETYGEDPVLVSEIGGAWIKGYQSNGLWVTPKHFGAHGAPLGGRDSHDIGLSEREIREVHLVPFRHVVKTYDVQSIMENYSGYLGVPVAKSKELLHGILREEWGFSGFIVSDCGAIENLTKKKHYTAINIVDAAKQGLAAGIATNCGSVYNNKEVIAAAKNGQISMDDLDNVCRSMLLPFFKKGLFENAPKPIHDWDNPHPTWNTLENKELAREAARKSIVLLENKENILPLSKSIGSVAVIGPGADDLQPGDYSPKMQPGQLKSVLTGIQSSIGKNAKVNYALGCEFFSTENTDIENAVKMAMASDVAVLVLGDCSYSESEKRGRKTSGEGNDYASLILPGDQQKLLEAVCETGKPVILVLQSGRPYNLSYASEHCEAILVNWLPGQEGGFATADVLFGDFNPAGRLPMTFPRDVSQLPLYYNFKSSGRGYHYVDMKFYPLYSFGYGLSYTEFHYSDLKVEQKEDGTVEASATVTNIGDVEGDEVVQLYVTDMYASVKTRVMELKDFTRINLAPGESQEVNFKLRPYQISLLNDQMDRVVEAGDFKVMVGGSSPSYFAGDAIKHRVKYNNAEEGLSEMLNYKKAFEANFDISFERIEEKLNSNGRTVLVKVKNSGNLTDVGKLKMYVNGTQDEEIHHFELAPNQEKIICFEIINPDAKNVTVISKYKSISTVIQ